ncbi:helicase swr1 [Cryomyces antarcticus]
MHDGERVCVFPADQDHTTPSTQTESNILKQDTQADLDSASLYTNGDHPPVQNGHSETSHADTIETSNHDSAAPSTKKRKLAELNSRSRSASRHVSPPWKKVAVEGPTSFVEDGRRKSSRTNAVPPQLQPPSGKRQTRASHDQSSLVTPRSRASTLQNVVTAETRPASAPGSQKSSAATGETTSRGGPPARKHKHQENFSASSSHPETPSHHDVNASPQILKSEPNHMPPPSPVQVKRKPGRPSFAEKARRAAELSAIQQAEVGRAVAFTVQPIRQPVQVQRFTLKLRRPDPPILHPKNILPVPKHSSLQEFLDNDDPLEDEKAARKNEGRVIRTAEAEAKLRLKLLEKARPGGILSEPLCSVYMPDEQDKPPPRYDHSDYILAHALELRHLMKSEHEHHRDSARKLAIACAEVWKSKQPKTEEQLWEEEKQHQDTIQRQVIRDLQKKWELVGDEVRKRRLAKLEAEKDAMANQNLKKMVEDSTALLEQRRVRLSSELLSNDYGEDGEEEGEEETDGADGEDNDDRSEENVSANESEEESEQEDEDDKHLTREEMLQKYAAALGSGNPGASAQVENNSLNDDIAGARPENHDAGAADGEHTESDTDVADVVVEDVDSDLLDDEDETTDMDDDSTSAESGLDEDGDEEEDDEDPGWGVAGFLSSRQLAVLQEPTNSAGTDVAKSPSLAAIPDAAASPLRSFALAEDSGPSQRADILRSEVSTNANPASSIPSRQNSPDDGTTIDPTEPESVTSLGVHDGSEKRSLEITPQPVDSILTRVPSLLRGELRTYQHFGLDWLAKLYDNSTNGILADEMGLGKTVQTIALLAHLAIEHQVWGTHLIVVPTSVILNWEMEFKKFLPGFKVLPYYGDYEERKVLRKGWQNDDKWNVVITSYQLVIRDLSAIKQRKWHYLVLDEAHNIKNFESLRWQSMVRLRTEARLLLTGTPLQNNITELWSLLRFLVPENQEHGMADLEAFTKMFRKPVEQIMEQGKQKLDDDAKNIIAQMHHSLRPYILRRLKSQVEKQMPGKYEHIVSCKLSKRQRQLYDGFMSRADTKQALASGNHFSISNCLMSLRKVCNHPDLFDTRQIVTSFAMRKSAAAEFEIKDLLVRKRLLAEDPFERVDLDFLNLTPVANEDKVMLEIIRTRRIEATRPMAEIARQREQQVRPVTRFDGSTISSSVSYVQSTAQISKLDELLNFIRLTRIRTDKQPIYGRGFLDMVKLHFSVGSVPQPPKRKQHMSDWYLNTASKLSDMVPTLAQRSEFSSPSIRKFSCVTPAVVANDMASLTLSEKGVALVRSVQQPPELDPFHEARIRLSIAFPDKRLLQYDCGKLQRLDKLLRELQARGSRALIFTQMTSILDILEQFLNIHGHRYLRLDGSTKPEARQLSTDRFNNDNRILAFILSSRAGGLGLNLTGADTVIFYDIDWNPAMDKQCQDRAHRIGQTRDVHIYKFVSEHTIEANILRKSNQKRLLDNVVIQEGEFTTDYFNKVNIKDAFDDSTSVPEGDEDAGAAIDQVLGINNVDQVLASVEDKEDAEAAKAAKDAQIEAVGKDEMDFTGVDAEAANVTGAAAGQDIVMDVANEERPHVDEYMLRFMERDLDGAPVAPPAADKRSKERRRKDRERERQRRGR